MNKKLNIAIIGAGTIGNTHAENLSKVSRAKIIWAIDIVEEKAKHLAAKYGIEKTSADYRDAYKDPDIDAVYICLPNYLHKPFTVEALGMGKHVFCEKPAALSVAEARDMQTAAEKNKKLCVIGVVNRFNDYVNLIKKRISAGEYGTIYHVHCVFKQFRSIPGLGGWFTEKKKSGGGVVIDWGIHFLDLVLYCLDFPKLTSVNAVTNGSLGSGMKEYAFLSMWAGPPDYNGVYDVEEFASGMFRSAKTTISLDGAWAHNINEPAMYIDFIGDKGGLRHTYLKSFTSYFQKQGILLTETAAIPDRNIFHNEEEDFVSCCLDNKQSKADIKTVIGSQAALDAFYKSAEQKKEVEIKDV